MTGVGGEQSVHRTECQRVGVEARGRLGKRGDAGHVANAAIARAAQAVDLRGKPPDPLTRRNVLDGDAPGRRNRERDTRRSNLERMVAGGCDSR